MTNLPNLAGIATVDLVDQIGTGKFSASYINWSRTMHILRTHAPDWQPELVTAPDGYLLHQAPVGAYLMIRFRKGEEVTCAVPQAIMDTRNAAIPLDKITARDITDTHRRGVCLAAAFTFGLAYELWAKLPLESGYHDDEPPAPLPPKLISAEQAAQIKHLLQETGSDTAAFLGWVSKGCGSQVSSVDVMPEAAFTPSINLLSKKLETPK